MSVYHVGRLTGDIPVQRWKILELKSGVAGVLANDRHLFGCSTTTQDFHLSSKILEESDEWIRTRSRKYLKLGPQSFTWLPEELEQCTRFLSSWGLDEAEISEALNSCKSESTGTPAELAPSTLSPKTFGKTIVFQIDGTETLRYLGTQDSLARGETSVLFPSDGGPAYLIYVGISAKDAAAKPTFLISPEMISRIPPGPADTPQFDSPSRIDMELDDQNRKDFFLKISRLVDAGVIGIEAFV